MHNNNHHLVRRHLTLLPKEETLDNRMSSSQNHRTLPTAVKPSVENTIVIEIAHLATRLPCKDETNYLSRYQRPGYICLVAGRTIYPIRSCYMAGHDVNHKFVSTNRINAGDTPLAAGNCSISNNLNHVLNHMHPPLPAPTLEHIARCTPLCCCIQDIPKDALSIV